MPTLDVIEVLLLITAPLIANLPPEDQETWQMIADEAKEIRLELMN